MFALVVEVEKSQATPSASSKDVIIVLSLVLPSTQFVSDMVWILTESIIPLMAPVAIGSDPAPKIVSTALHEFCNA